MSVLGDPDALALLGNQLRRVLGSNLPVAALPLEMAPSGPIQGARLQSAVQTSTIPGDLGSFLGAIKGRESGGNYDWNNTSKAGARGAYQFIPSTWLSNVREMGGDPRDVSPAHQDAVAAHSASQLFNRYGDWGKVAQAWLGGPGSVGTGARDAYGTSVGSYANDVLGAMSRNPVVTDAPGTRALGEQVSSLHNTSTALRGKAAPLQASASQAEADNARINALAAQVMRTNNITNADLHGPVAVQHPTIGGSGNVKASKKKAKNTTDRIPMKGAY